MSNWEPTVGTLSAEELDGHLSELTDYAGWQEQDYDDPEGNHAAPIRAPIAALTAQLESARGIAVRLEQELAAKAADGEA